MTRDNAADRCARCDSEAPDAQALLAEARAQVEALRAERDAARDYARILGSVLALYATITRRRMAALLWRSARARKHRDLLAAYHSASDHRDALLRGLQQMRSDGLDIDDLSTAPHWTGKVLVGGRLVFDLATVEADAPAPEATPSPRG